MEEKIFQHLKGLRGNHLKVSDRTLREIAKVQTGRITDDAGLETLEHFKAIFESLEGNLRFNEAEAAKATEARIKAELEKKPDPATPPQTGTMTQEQINKAIAEGIAAGIKPIQDKILGFETQKSQEQIRKDALAKLKELPIYKNETNAFLMENEFNRLNGTFENADAVLTAAKALYEPIISKVGVKVEPNNPAGGGKAQENADYVAFKSQQSKKLGWKPEESAK